MHKKQVLTSLTIWDQLGTSTTGDVRPASPAAAAPVVVGDKDVEVSLDGEDEAGSSGDEGDDEDW